MFTGIVEEIGHVLEAATDRDSDNYLIIGCRTSLEGCKLGDSMAVNGVCLTITERTDQRFRVGVSPETLRRSNLGRLQADNPVNLERSLLVGSRMGGHYVQGHVDGIGEIVTIVPEGESKRVTIRPSGQLLPYIVEKGYIAIDGVSLTIAALDADTFTIALIAYTQQSVIMGNQQQGVIVNLEVDIIAKYVERLVEAHRITPLGAR